MDLFTNKCRYFRPQSWRSLRYWKKMSQNMYKIWVKSLHCPICKKNVWDIPLSIRNGPRDEIMTSATVSACPRQQKMDNFSHPGTRAKAGHHEQRVRDQWDVTEAKKKHCFHRGVICPGFKIFFHPDDSGFRNCCHLGSRRIPKKNRCGRFFPNGCAYVARFSLCFE